MWEGPVEDRTLGKDSMTYVLHGMGHIRGLDQMLDHDRCLPVSDVNIWFLRRNVAKRFFPPILAQVTQVLIEDVRGKNNVYYELPKLCELSLGGVNAVAQI